MNTLLQVITEMSAEIDELRDDRLSSMMEAASDNYSADLLEKYLVRLKDLHADSCATITKDPYYRDLSE